jgi:alpha-mannosidase
MSVSSVHLISNAHLDPVWQWEWEEGAAAAISTFRVAADLCETCNGFVFNHNEAILYQWVEEYEPVLFERIQRLVAAGRWHIMGGWYLQPDCNMPSGESFVRQILLGLSYFKTKFGARPHTAINFDPFGHTRGLVQILQKSGYTSYLFCRPGATDCSLPGEDFVWVGYDGSRILAHRSLEFYNSPLGHARDKVERCLVQREDEQDQLILWGVGDHGGGPSRLDVARLQALIGENPAHDIRHSTPEAYFADLAAHRAALPEHHGDINAWAVGCYTSQSRIKQRHRHLENELYATEKMLAGAALVTGLAYPQADLHAATKDLLFAEFHDILPGSSVQPVEEMALRLMDHGLEILSRLKARAFFALCAGQPPAAPGEIPILIYNPHPYPVRGIFECEFMLADQNWQEEFTMPLVYQGDRLLPSQPEQELGNVNLDWRKRVVFRAELAPSQINRFDCRLQVLPARPRPHLVAQDGKLIIKTETLEVVINCTTGLLDRYRVNGVDFLTPAASRPLVIADNEDPWGMTVSSYRDVIGSFGLMTPEDSAAFAGVRAAALAPVRIIEDGPVRTVVESLLRYDHSALCMRYKIPKHGTELEIEVRVEWREKSRMLKLAFPTPFTGARYLGQVAYGVGELPMDGREAVSQKWSGIFDEMSGQALTCINDGSYGSDFSAGEMRLSLVRSPGYAGHPIYDRPIMPQDRYSPRTDQGERVYTFWLNGGPATERHTHVEREAQRHNERPFTLSFFPDGKGEASEPVLILGDPVVVLSAFKKAENGEGYILRLFEPTGAARSARVRLPRLGIEQTVEFGGFEVKTLRLDSTIPTLQETDLLEGTL